MKIRIQNLVSALLGFSKRISEGILFLFAEKKRQIFAYALALFLAPALAFGMQSNLYKIQSDTVNIGGVEASSTTYIVNDTVGEQATGDSASASYAVHAGFWQMQESYIAISSPSDVALSSISGLTGGTSTASAGWNVVTDNEAGYTLSIRASTSPALASSNDSFADYAPANPGTPDFVFSILASASEFAFSPEGSDITQKFKDNGSACNTGSGDTTDACWDGLTTSNTTISQASLANHPGGATTTVKFRASSGDSHIQTSGSYSATITVTAITL